MEGNIPGITPTGLNILSKDLSYSLFFKDNRDLLRVIDPIPLASFPKYDSKRDVKNEFKLLLKMTENLNFDELKIAYDADIFKLNRYSNILPYKHSMVSLTNPDQEIPSKTDRYINANFIYNPYTAQSKPTWIATQGPMPVTYGHFWRMVWQQNSRKVLMLNGCSDEGKSPDLYFPENVDSETQRHSDFEVSVMEFQPVNQFYHTRELELKNLRSGEIRRVTHYNVVGWPDKKTPPVGSTDAFEELLGLLAEVGIDQEEPIEPMVLHCAAGIGRTGTFLSLFWLTRLLRKYLGFFKPNKNIESFPKLGLSVFGTVRSLREQRMGLVQNLEQYEYVYWFMSNTIGKILKK